MLILVWVQMPFWMFSFVSLLSQPSRFIAYREPLLILNLREIKKPVLLDHASFSSDLSIQLWPQLRRYRLVKKKCSILKWAVLPSPAGIECPLCAIFLTILFSPSLNWFTELIINAPEGLVEFQPSSFKACLLTSTLDLCVFILNSHFHNKQGSCWFLSLLSNFY